jgi:hypothetical protein
MRDFDKRALLNEDIFFDILIEKIAKTYTSIEIVFDSISVTQSNMQNILIQNKISRLNMRINKILLKYKNISIININGLVIEEALKIISLVDFYITHEGTMHHKLGWFQPNKKGIIFTSSCYSKSVAEWHADQIEGVETPHTLPDYFYYTFGGNRDSNYVLIDPNEAAKFCINLIEDLTCPDFFEQR